MPSGSVAKRHCPSRRQRWRPKDAPAPPLPFSLDRHKPLSAPARYGDVLGRAEHVTAIAVGQPAELWQEHTTVSLIELGLLRVRVTETVGLPLLVEVREVGSLGEEVGTGPLQVLECLVQRMYWGIGQPRRVGAVSPLGKQLAQSGIAELLLTLFVTRLLQCQRFVKHEPARTSKAAHLPRLLSIWKQLASEGSKSSYGSIILLVYE